MFLIVGLGNPGPEYEKHRHNIGFRIVDALRARWSFGTPRKEFAGQFVKGEWQAQPIGLLKPQTYMNRSGESAQQAIQFFKVAPESVLCIHDELDLPFGTLRLKVGGGTAGHNGLKSMVAHCGDNFLRLRIGIGRPQHGATENYVLNGFSADENAELGNVITRAVEFTESLLADGANAAMNKFHADV